MLKGEEMIVELIQALGLLKVHFGFTWLNFTEAEWLLKLSAEELLIPECKGSESVQRKRAVCVARCHDISSGRNLFEMIGIFQTYEGFIFEGLRFIGSIIAL
jgi:hypothetical protein